MKLIIFIVSLSIINCVYTLSEPCTNPDERCMHYEMCPQDIKDMLNMVRQPGFNDANVIAKLRNARCGERKQRKLCCKLPECHTWDGRPGTCVPVSEGDTRMTNRQLKLSLCTKKGRFVCKSDLPVKQTGSCNSEISAFLPDPKFGCCGKDRHNDDRIIGGSGTALDQFPWLAVLQYSNNVKNCSGALISGRYILTAAHCVIDDDVQPYAVVLGEHDKRSTHDCDQFDCEDNKELTIGIGEIIVHSNFDINSRGGKNDIALIRLERMATYSDFILPICLPMTDWNSKRRPPANLKLWAAGWGNVDPNRHSPSDIKRKVQLPYVGLRDCVDRTRTNLWSSQMCAGGEEHKDSCSGDSGSPLMYERDGIYEVLGITSYGITKCGTKDVPAVYTKVYSYLHWIHSHLWN